MSALVHLIHALAAAPPDSDDAARLAADLSAAAQALQREIAAGRAAPDGQALAARGSMEGAELAASAAAFARGAAGVRLAPAPEALRSLADDMEARWRPRAEAAGAGLRVSYAGDPAHAAMIDGARLRQVLDALLDRAFRAGGPGGVELALAAAAAPEGLRVNVQVRDAGPALGPEALQAVFAPFAAVSPGAGGGMALALAHQVVQAMGGRLTAAAGPGAGATLALDLVLARAPAPATAAEAPHAKPAGLDRPAHVLVVDDNATNRMVAQTLCRIYGASSEAAVDGVEAVELAGSGAFDLVLMDIRMPRMDGVQATRAIRALVGAPGRLPIIALTANAEPEAAAEYLAAGMDAVVEKPIQSDVLLGAMRAALARAAQGASEAQEAAAPPFRRHAGAP